MKKVLALTLIFILSAVSYFNFTKSENIQEKIAGKIIRLHVIGNSDSIEDQRVKLIVRDKVLAYVKDKLASCENIDDSKKVLLSYNDEIVNIAKEALKDNNMTYSAEAALKDDVFPVKQYGNIVLPEGKYEAYELVLGNGEGHNWWCVMFPPLCFIDITKGEASIDETSKEMSKVLTKDEFNAVDNSDNKIIIKFKIIEIIKNLFQ